MILVDLRYLVMFRVENLDPRTAVDDPTGINIPDLRMAYSSNSMAASSSSLRWQLNYLLCSPLGEMIQFDLIILFREVTTTNQ